MYNFTCTTDPRVGVMDKVVENDETSAEVAPVKKLGPGLHSFKRRKTGERWVERTVSLPSQLLETPRAGPTFLVVREEEEPE